MMMMMMMMMRLFGTDVGRLDSNEPVVVLNASVLERSNATKRYKRREIRK